MPNLKKKINAIIALIFLGSIIACWKFYKIESRRTEAIDQAAASFLTLQEISSSVSTLKDLEIAEQRYAIFGETLDLAPSKTPNILQAQQLLTQQIDTLDNLLKLNKLNTVQKRFIGEVKPLIAQKIQLSAQIISRRQAGFDAAKTLNLPTTASQKIFDLFALMSDAQQSRYQADLQKLEETNLSARQILGILGFCLLIALGLIYFLARQFALTKMQLEAKLQEISVRDELTGLYNRRELNRLLQSEVERFKRHRYPFGFILFTIDDFKLINETHGQKVGEQVLQWVAQQVLISIRNFDLAARFGTEDFAIILPNLDLNESFVVAERIRNRIANNRFIKNLGENLSGENLNGGNLNGDVQCEIDVTICAGVSTVKKNADSELTLISESGKALQHAKSTSKNCTMTAENSGELQEIGLLASN